MSPEDAVLAALSIKSMTCAELSRFTGMREMTVMGILRRLKLANEVRVDGYGLYQRFYGYGPGNGGAA